MESLQNFGIALIVALQTLSPALDGVMYFFSFLGTVEFFMIFIPLVYWLVDPKLGFRLLILLNLTTLVTMSCKLLFHQPRPYWLGGVKELSTEPSYGIPSSHASSSVAMLGYLAYRLKKNWLTALLVGVVLLIALSRLYLGVHFPHDVLAGWLIGFLMIVVFVWGEKKLSPWLNRLSAGAQTSLGFAVSLAIILIGLLIRVLIAPYPDPAAWADFAIQARSLSYHVTLAGTFFGAVAGYSLMLRYASFRPAATWWRLIVCYALGIVSLLILNSGLDLLFGLLAADESTIGFLLRYIRYATINFWAIFAAPWIFLNLKLVRPAVE